MEFLVHYLLIAILFVGIDAIWLKLSQPFYASMLGDLMAKKADLRPAAVFYFLYVLAVTVFVVDPALGENSFLYALSHGALLGLVMFATYDLTNQATLRRWPVKVTLVDIAWGTLSTTLVSVVAFLILN